MITVTKQENGVLFTFQDSNKYLYGSGTILVPFNSLSIIMDESDMITLRKSASNDIFLSARYDTDLGYASKEEAVNALKEILYDEAGISEEEVQEMIDAATSAKADASAITSIESAVTTLSGAVIDNEYTVSQAINSLNNRVIAVESTKQDTLVSGTNIKTINGESILGEGNITIEGGGGGGMDDDTQQLISTALNDLNDRKADLTELSKYQKKGDYVKTSTLADYMTNDAFEAKERIISGALNDLNDKFGGLRLVKISQSEYDALPTKDENTLYIINNVI